MSLDSTNPSLSFHSNPHNTSNSNSNSNTYKLRSNRTRNSNSNPEVTNYKWIDHGSYYEFNAPQGSDPWKNARIGRAISSKSSALAGKSNFKNSDPEYVGKVLAGVINEQFEAKNEEYMNHGVRYEPIARAWYENKYNCKIKLKGLCVPKNDLFIGASIDGEICGTNGLIEIKCPQKMYKGILSYSENIQRGWKPPPRYYDHILGSHLDQIMQAMAILGKQYCDYIVYCTSTEQVFVQRIYFSAEYWNQHYMKLKQNYEKYVRPHLRNGLPLMPS